MRSTGAADGRSITNIHNAAATSSPPFADSASCFVDTTTFDPCCVWPAGKLVDELRSYGMRAKRNGANLEVQVEIDRLMPAPRRLCMVSDIFACASGTSLFHSTKSVFCGTLKLR